MALLYVRPLDPWFDFSGNVRGLRYRYLNLFDLLPQRLEEWNAVVRTIISRPLNELMRMCFRRTRVMVDNLILYAVTRGTLTA